MNTANNTGEQPCMYIDEAQQFLKDHMAEDQYEVIMGTREGKDLPYVAARIFLSEEDWQQYLWIIRHGSLEGYAKAK